MGLVPPLYNSCDNHGLDWQQYKMYTESVYGQDSLLCNSLQCKLVSLAYFYLKTKAWSSLKEVGQLIAGSADVSHYW